MLTVGSKIFIICNHIPNHTEIVTREWILRTDGREI